MKSFITENFQFVNYIEMDNVQNDFIWQTRNIPQIRQNMTNKEYISKDEHNLFLKNLKNNRIHDYFCVIWNGSCIGSVNVKYMDNHSIEIGIFLHPNYIGKGLAQQISRELYAYLHINKGINVVKTRVLKDNSASIALQLALGAVCDASDELYNYYSLFL